MMRLPDVALAFTLSIGLGHQGRLCPVSEHSLECSTSRRNYTMRTGWQSSCPLMLTVTPLWAAPFLHKLDLAIRRARKLFQTHCPVVER